MKVTSLSCYFLVISTSGHLLWCLSLGWLHLRSYWHTLWPQATAHSPYTILSPTGRMVWAIVIQILILNFKLKPDFSQALPFRLLMRLPTIIVIWFSFAGWLQGGSQCQPFVSDIPVTGTASYSFQLSCLQEPATGGSQNQVLAPKISVPIAPYSF
jgi:hypothetical protein